MLENQQAEAVLAHRNHKVSKIVYGISRTMFRHAFLVFRTYLDMFLDFVFGFLWDGSRKAIPDLNKKHNILTESALTLAAKIRNKELKSEELVKACIERIQLVNPILNAVTDERFEDALDDARKVDKLIENGLSEEYFQRRPFLGVPFTAKESHAVAGMRHTLGILSRSHVRAHEDAECVRLMKEAGAIPLAITNVPEINKWQETRNMLFGQTNNPYHAGRTTGGSSGGEAALAAALATPIALCSDIGGSTRMPAFYCGLFALNPTAGHTSLKGSALRSGNNPTMASIGFVSRHCSDLAPLTKVVAADKAADLDLDGTVDLKKIMFYYTETAKDLRVSPICAELREAMNKVVSKVAETSSSPPSEYYHAGFDYMYSLWRHAMTKEGDSFPKLLANQQGEAKGLLELPKKLVGASPFTLAAILKLLDEQVMSQVDPRWAEPLTEELLQDLTSTLGDDGVLLFPSAPSPAPYHYSLLLKPFNFAYWGIFNVLKLPVVQVPLGLSASGLPLGLQVVAGPRRERLALAVGGMLQDYFGGYVPPCRLLD